MTTTTNKGGGAVHRLTLYEGDTRTVGIDARIVLLDGSVVRYRYTGPPGEMLMAIVKDAP